MSFWIDQYGNVGRVEEMPRGARRIGGGWGYGYQQPYNRVAGGYRMGDVFDDIAMQVQNTVPQSPPPVDYSMIFFVILAAGATYYIMTNK